MQQPVVAQYVLHRLSALPQTHGMLCRTLAQAGVCMQIMQAKACRIPPLSCAAPTVGLPTTEFTGLYRPKQRRGCLKQSHTCYTACMSRGAQKAACCCVTCLMPTGLRLTDTLAVQAAKAHIPYMPELAAALASHGTSAELGVMGTTGLSGSYYSVLLSKPVSCCRLSAAAVRCYLPVTVGQ
jgi:hypothetical protein